MRDETLDTKKNEKKSSTNTAPLPAASRVATAHARVVRAVRARPRTVWSKSSDDSLIEVLCDHQDFKSGFTFDLVSRGH